MITDKLFFKKSISCTSTTVLKTKTESGLKNLYVISLKMNLERNGELTFTKSKVSDNYKKSFFDLLTFFKCNIYPIEFVGKITNPENTELILSKKGYSFFGSKIPTKFICTIDKRQNIQLKAYDFEWEIVGNYHIQELRGQIDFEKK